MIYGEILAGGSGTRMGNTEMPKQFLMLGERPIIIHTIEQFLINQAFSKIVVCCPKEWVSYAEDLLDKYNIDKDKVEITAGGATRNESIMNGCKYIEEKFKNIGHCLSLWRRRNDSYINKYIKRA